MVSVQTSATVGNFGPGFDVLSLALHGGGDRITMAVADDDAIQVSGPGADAVPTAWDRNVVGPTLDALRARTGIDDPLAVTIEKPRPGGSGLGSSAASAGGAALAFHAMHAEARLGPDALVAAAFQGERAAGGGNPDDVAAVIVGGLAIVQPGPAGPEDGLSVRRVAPPDGLNLAIAVPALVLETTKMRSVLPDAIPRDDAVWNLGHTAAMVDAFHRGDIGAIGAAFNDRMATPHRAAYMPYLADVLAAATAAGAHGAGLSGSGPAVVAVCDDAMVAQVAGAAMAETVRAHSLSCDTLVATPEHEVPHETVLH